MSGLDISFEKFLGRQPTDAEVQKLYRVRDALELKNNDALWLVLMALQHYETSYKEMPAAIEAVATSVLADVKTTADTTMKASAESFKADMARAVASVAQEVARDTSRKQMWQWAGGAVAAAFLSIALIGWVPSIKVFMQVKTKAMSRPKTRKPLLPGPTHPKVKVPTV